MGLFKDKFKKLEGNNNAKHESKDKKKIENIVFLIIVLIITIIIINTILKDDSDTSTDNSQNITDKVLAGNTTNSSGASVSSDDLEENLAEILSTIKDVGKVNVFINYSESSKTIAMYDEKTTTSSTEETDSSGGVRNTTSTETQKNVICSEDSGNQVPVTEKIVMPTIEGAIITAEGASNSKVKANIVSAVQAATGLSIDKIQVFEMK